MSSEDILKTRAEREKVETGVLAGLAGMAMRSLNWEQRMLEATQAANHKKIYDEAAPKVEDDMQIVLGDVTNTTQAPQPSKSNAILKGAIGAGLIATGAGLAVGGPLILDAIRDLKGETTIIQEDGPRYLLQLGDPIER